VLISKKSATPPLYKGLSSEYKSRLVLGEARSTDKSVTEHFKAIDFPSVYVIPKESGAEPVLYKGEMKYAALTKFLSTYAAPEKKSKAGKKAENSSSKKQEKAKKEKEKEPEPVKEEEPCMYFPDNSLPRMKN
jgi:protein disulfide-isomerase A6